MPVKFDTKTKLIFKGLNRHYKYGGVEILVIKQNLQSCDFGGMRPENCLGKHGLSGQNGSPIVSECIHLYGKLNIDCTELVSCMSILSHSELRVPSYLMIVLPTLYMYFRC